MISIIGKNIAIIFLIFPLLCCQNIFAKDQCNLNNVISLNIFSKKDYNFYSYMCNAVEGMYLKSYIVNKENNIFLNQYEDFSAKENPKLLAVSIYKTKNKKIPVLITLNSSYYCCTPQMEGYMYKINLYQAHKINNKILLKDITKILGKNGEGFEGMVEGRIHYNLKDIASIKKWLDENY